jgi:cell division protease FtsH
MDRIAVLLGGRVAEEIVFNEISTGAGNDLERVTELARSMVMEYGMSRELGPVNLAGPRRTQFLNADGGAPSQRNYSEETAREIDAEIKGLIDGTYERVRRLLTADRDVLEVLARRLLEKEVVDEGELREIMGLPQRTHEPAPERVVETPPPSPLADTQAAAAAPVEPVDAPLSVNVVPPAVPPADGAEATQLDTAAAAPEPTKPTRSRRKR